ncbi:MAG: hypothetical protein RIR12_345 [Bacteroidota bacterium]|jgi:hypothetical protein
MKLILTTFFFALAFTTFGQQSKISAKEIYTGKAGAFSMTVYIETVQTFSSDFNDFITTAHKGWYKKANGLKISIYDTWEGSGPMTFKETINGKKVATLELEDYTEEGKRKTLKGTLKKNGKTENVTLTLQKKL